MDHSSFVDGIDSFDDSSEESNDFVELERFSLSLEFLKVIPKRSLVEIFQDQPDFGIRRFLDNLK